MAQRKKRQKLKTLHLLEELHEKIKAAAHKNNRKIIQEISERFK